jgi:hypothetical protein
MSNPFTKAAQRRITACAIFTTLLIQRRNSARPRFPLVQALSAFAAKWELWQRNVLCLSSEYKIKKPDMSSCTVIVGRNTYFLESSIDFD